jgi:hypothetical protein
MDYRYLSYTPRSEEQGACITLFCRSRLELPTMPDRGGRPEGASSRRRGSRVHVGHTESRAFGAAMAYSISHFRTKLYGPYSRTSLDGEHPFCRRSVIVAWHGENDALLSIAA